MLGRSHLYATSRCFPRSVQAARSHPTWSPVSVPLRCSARWSSTGTSSTDAEKPYYITTPIFYVNAAPHVGHLYSMVLADVIKRWQLLKGRRAILTTGIDEHGMKVQQAALKAGSEPKPFCDKGAEIFKVRKEHPTPEVGVDVLQALAESSMVSYDHFVRTTDPDHREAVQYAWTLLRERGHIYLSKHEGWYSVSDETFYPQSGVHLIVEPSTGRKIMASMETGKEVEWTSETNYRFRLSNFKQPLLDFYRDNPYFIIPKTRYNDVIQAVSDGLEDLSVSRPSQRLSWGIPVPTDASQTIYVWLDALTNYITKAGYPWTPGQESALGWPADCQLIGKDIVRFHCIYWPAFLMALDIPPPKQILTHAHWTLGREKMAKSTGNVVNPFFALNRFGVDLMRFYLAHDGGIAQDADYNNEYIIERYKKALAGGLGNLASRVLRGKGWNVRRAVQRAATGETAPFNSSAVIQFQYDLLKDTPMRVKHKMDLLDVSGAIKKIMSMVYATNAFLQQTQPWDLAKHTDPTHTLQLDQIIYLSAEAVRLAAILLQPVMPARMEQLMDMLGMAAGARGLEYAEFGADAEFGVGGVELGRGLVGVLFPPLTSDA